MTQIKIDKEKCVGCGTCVETCPVNLYAMDGDKAAFVGDVDDCLICRACEAACPAAAIEVIE
ncbi:MAG: 4Fe-4S binding protein [Candidatus Altiarchaeota archaeon]|nr:4Fe-4S binding protein [Candidatus Altiarchaeota archaeon]